MYELGKTKETRSAEVAASVAGGMTLEGMPVVFEQPTTIGLENGSSFTEIIHRGALDHCDLNDVTLKVNHNDVMVPLARVPKTMRLETTDTGLLMRAELAGDSPQARDVYSAVKRGDLRGMSFAFVVAEGGSSYDPATNTRHITSIAKVYECSICERPAYAMASVEARDAIAAARDADRMRAAARADRVAALARVSDYIRKLELGINSEV